MSDTYPEIVDYVYMPDMEFDEMVAGLIAVAANMTATTVDEINEKIVAVMEEEDQSEMEATNRVFNALGLPDASDMYYALAEAANKYRALEALTEATTSKAQ